MTELLEPTAIGTPRVRREGALKVTGTAPYAHEHPVTGEGGALLHVHLLGATVARGTITGIDTAAALAVDGVESVLTHASGVEMADTANGDLVALQSPDVAYRGQVVAVVLAATPEAAREGAARVRVSYDAQPHRAELRADDPELYAPEQVNAGHATEYTDGDVDAALAAAAVQVDGTYTTPQEVNSPLEPHAVTALFHGAQEHPALELWASTQGPHMLAGAMATALGLETDQVRVVAPHVGGGFGSKGTAHSHDVVTALAARTVPGRPVSLALTRQQTFALVGYRAPTIQRVRLGADADGRLTAMSQEVVEQTSQVAEFAEQTGAGIRSTYASTTRRSTHLLAALDVPANFWMRAPGEMPGSFATEVAMDELAQACGLDPVELRVRNEPEADPETGKEWGQRLLVRCLRKGAERFGWAGRDPAPRARLVDGWWVGTGMAVATYPHLTNPSNEAEVERTADGWVVRIGASDIGTGARTVLGQITADALGVDVDRVEVELGSTDQPAAALAGGSWGTSSWGATVVEAARAFRGEHGDDAPVGACSRGSMPENELLDELTHCSFGAQFAQVSVHADTGEVRADRLLGVFSLGRAINPRTLRSQLLGGMIMGLSGALHEDAVRDPRFGHVVTQDLASYHVAANADVREIEAVWLDEPDPRSNAMGSRGAGEIGIVGMAAAVANAVHHATGVRVRRLPVTADLLL